MTTAIIIIVVLLILAVIAAALMMRTRQQKRREGLQERFGPEYDRAVETHGDRKAAEKRLADAADRRDKVEIRALDPGERERYSRQWTDVQAAFVDEPGAATRDADRLVQSVMRDRGYPVDDFATRAEMLATDHPEVVEHYREAHAVGSRTESADTESLRQAFVHYRALFALLLDEGHAPTGTGRTDTMERTDTMDRTGDINRGSGTDAERVDLRDQPTRRTT
jgi:hypothetical protein